MTRSRRGVFIPLPSKLSGRGVQVVTSNAVSYGDLVVRSNDVATGDVATSVSPVADGTFYGDLSTPELHAELVRLGQIMQNSGLLA